MRRPVAAVPTAAAVPVARDAPAGAPDAGPPAPDRLAVSFRPRVRKVPTVRRRDSKRLSSALEVLAVAVATSAAVLGARVAGIPPGPVAPIVAFDLLTLMLCRRWAPCAALRPSVVDDVAHAVAAATLAGIAVLGVRALIAPAPGMAAQTFRLWVFVGAYLTVTRVALATCRWRHHLGPSGVKTLIVGAGVVGRRLAARLLEQPSATLRPIGFLDDDPLDGGRGAPLPVLGRTPDLEREVARHGVGHIVVAFSRIPHPVLLDLLRRCRALGLSVSLVPSLYEEVTRRVSIEHLGGIPLIRVVHNDPRGWQMRVKYGIDRVLAAVSLVLFGPLMLVIALAVRISSGPPVLYRCRRVGRDGRPFDLLKFRTMVGTPETHGGFNDHWAASVVGDGESSSEPVDRRTHLGRTLRRLSLDELPQLINVLRGEMSLIGPRPERVGLASRFEAHVYRYGDRHRVKAGITGWAQVNGLRGNTSLADRIEWDNYYIENWSPLLDLKIAILTLPALVMGRNAE